MKIQQKSQLDYQKYSNPELYDIFGETRAKSPDILGIHLINTAATITATTTYGTGLGPREKFI